MPNLCIYEHGMSLHFFRSLVSLTSVLALSTSKFHCGSSSHCGCLSHPQCLPKHVLEMTKEWFCCHFMGDFFLFVYNDRNQTWGFMHERQIFYWTLSSALLPFWEILSLQREKWVELQSSHIPLTWPLCCSIRLVTLVLDELMLTDYPVTGNEPILTSYPKPMVYTNIHSLWCGLAFSPYVHHHCNFWTLKSYMIQPFIPPSLPHSLSPPNCLHSAALWLFVSQNTTLWMAWYLSFQINSFHLAMHVPSFFQSSYSLFLTLSLTFFTQVHQFV